MTELTKSAFEVTKSLELNVWTIVFLLSRTAHRCHFKQQCGMWSQKSSRILNNVNIFMKSYSHERFSFVFQWLVKDPMKDNVRVLFRLSKWLAKYKYYASWHKHMHLCLVGNNLRYHTNILEFPGQITLQPAKKVQWHAAASGHELLKQSIFNMFRIMTTD